MADYYGTLSAARCLGREGVQVTMAEGRWLTPARWSRFVTDRVRCPPVGEPNRLMEWISRYGEERPGQVLYPTSDEMAWLFALHKDALSRHFKLYSPGFDAVWSLLNKKKLFLACAEVGLLAPKTYFPDSDASLRQVAKEARFPVLIKPQTQILFESHVKGSQVEGPDELVERYREFVRKNRYGEELLSRDPDVVHPMVQAFHPEAARSIYSLSGFVDERCERFEFRAAVKVLQRPRKLGIGLCFEHAEVKQELAAKVVALCRKVGYYGVFEVEFIQADGEFLLIDFNPRFYSQMGFDIARGLPLPLMVWLGATGQEARLDAVLAESKAWKPSGKPVYSHRMMLELLLRAQSLSGKLSEEEVRYWRAWYASSSAEATDAVMDRDDWLPAVVDTVATLKGYARHPRAFFRSMVLDR